LKSILVPQFVTRPSTHFYWSKMYFTVQMMGGRVSK